MNTHSNYSKKNVCFSKKTNNQRRATKKRSHSDDQDGGNPIFRTCFVGGLHIRLKEGDLLKYMKKHHPKIEIESIKFIPGKREKDANRGFGFMTFKNEEDYKKVLKLQIVLRGKTINFRKAKSYQELKSSEKNLFKNRVIVKNLPRKACDEDLFKIFNHFGWDIERCYVIRDSNTLASKRIAFLDFGNNQDLEECLKSDHVFKLGTKILALERFNEDKSQTVGKKSNNKNISKLEETSESSNSNSDQIPNATSQNYQNPEKENKDEKEVTRWTFLYPSKKKLLTDEVCNYRVNKRGPIKRPHYGYHGLYANKFVDSRFLPYW